MLVAHCSGAKRKRPSNAPVACATCYKQKLKCDNKRPCGRCVKNRRADGCRDRSDDEVASEQAKRRKLRHQPPPELKQPMCDLRSKRTTF